MTEDTTKFGVSRRTLAKGAAWSVPAVAVAAAAPAYAQSLPDECVGPVCVTLTGLACKHPGNPKWYHFETSIENDSATESFTVVFTSMNVNGVVRNVTPSSATVAPNSTLTIAVDAGLYDNSANGVATLNFTVDSVPGSATTNVNDLPPCGVGNHPWVSAQPKGDPPHTAGRIAAETQADAQAKADADQAAADAQAKANADQATADAQAKTDADQAETQAEAALADAEADA